METTKILEKDFKVKKKNDYKVQKKNKRSQTNYYEAKKSTKIPLSLPCAGHLLLTTGTCPLVRFAYPVRLSWGKLTFPLSGYQLEIASGWGMGPVSTSPLNPVTPSALSYADPMPASIVSVSSCICHIIHKIKYLFCYKIKGWYKSTTNAYIVHIYLVSWTHHRK